MKEKKKKERKRKMGVIILCENLTKEEKNKKKKKNCFSVLKIVCDFSLLCLFFFFWFVLTLKIINDDIDFPNQSGYWGEAIFSLLLFAHISIIEIIIKNASKARLQNVYTES